MNTLYRVHYHKPSCPNHHPLYCSARRNLPDRGGPGKRSQGCLDGVNPKGRSYKIHFSFWGRFRPCPFCIFRFLGICKL